MSAINNSSSNSATISALFTSYVEATNSAMKNAELTALAVSIFNQVAELCNLTEEDLLWMGIDILDEKAYASFMKDPNAIINAAKIAAAFSNIGLGVFPKEYLSIDPQVTNILGDFTEESQKKAVVKYCTSNGINLLSFDEEEIKLGDKIITISAWDLDDLLKDSTTEIVSDLTVTTSNGLNRYSTNPVNGVNMNSFSILNAAKTCSTKEQLAEFVTQFGNFTKTGELTYQLKPAFNVLTYGHIEVNFEELTITTSKEFILRQRGYVSGYGKLTGEQLLALIMISITGGNDEFWGQSYIDAYLNSITATEEEQDLYGDKMEASQQLRVIRENSLAILAVRDYDRKYPYFQIVNNNTAQGVDEAAKYLMKNQIPFFVDKNAMKRVVVGAGVTALYAAMDFKLGVLKTILDVAKPGKLFTRGWQTLCTPAAQGIKGLQLDAVKHRNSNLVLSHYHINGEIEEITIKGERANTITGDFNFLINGSGVGYTWKSWAASCSKALRDSFNASSLKEGETLDQVKLELTDALNGLLKDRSIRKSGSHLLTFRGRPLLSYSGLNQQFVTSSDYGCDFTIRELGTSKTLSIIFNVVYFYTDKEAKVRGLGEKTVLKQSKFADLLNTQGEIVKTDVLLGSECLKGNAARLQQYAEFVKVMLGESEQTKVKLIGGHHPQAMEAIEAPEFEIDESTGVWNWTGDRTIQSLDDLNTPFYKWWKSNTKEYALRDVMAIHDFTWLLLGRAGLQQEWDGVSTIGQDLLDQALNHSSNSQVKLLDASGNYTTSLAEAIYMRGFVRVEEKANGVHAPYVFQLELASIRECSNAGQSSTIQQIASVYASNPALGEALADGVKVDGNFLRYQSIEQEDAVLALVAMSLNDVAFKATGSHYLPASKLTTWTLKDLINFNASIFNNGANAMYGSNSDPYLAFFVPNVGKKFKPASLLNKVGLEHIECGNTQFTFVQAMEGSAKNYTMNVGTGYNVASVATCLAAIARYELVKAMQSKQPKTTIQMLAEEVKLMGWVNAIAWKTVYENAWLASYNEKGETLSEKLHEYRKGFVPNKDPKLCKTPEEVIADIKAIFCKIEDVPTSAIADKWVSKFLYCYKIARAVGKVERDPKGLSKSFYDLALSEEDTKFIAVCGAFRRSDQGRFANNSELVGADGEEGQGLSMWALLNWDIVAPMLPNWLSRKLYKGMQAQLAISEFTKVINNSKGENFFSVDESLRDSVIFDSDRDQVTLTSTLDNLSLESIGIPTIEFEFANQDGDSTIPVAVKQGGKVVIEDQNPLDLQGAFMHYTLYCPVKSVEDSDGNVSSFVPDMEVKGAMKLNFAGSECWLWKRNLTSKEVIEHAVRRYPNGALISASEAIQGNTPSIYIDFAAVLKTGAFTPSGAATGFALTLSNFMVHMSRKAVENKKVRNEADFRKYGRNQIAGLQGQLREGLKSGTIKRIGKSAPTKQGSKIQTSHSCPYITTDAGMIPAFMLNPQDEVVKEGGYKSGDFVSISRTPMIAKAYGVILLSKDVAIGHLDVSGKVFALSNRGDGK